MDKPTENNMLVELTPIVTSRIRHGSKGDVKVFLDKLSKKLKIKIGGHIGSGWFGYAYALPGNKVLKLTADGTEYLNAKKLIGEKWNHIVNVYEAYALKEPYDGVYAIIMERIKQPPNLGAMMDHLLKHINIITNKPSKFNKDGTYSYFSEIIFNYGEGKITDEQINYYKSELKKIDPKLEKLFTQVLSMAAELSANDITAIQDIHGDNVGIKNGKLALLDIGSVDEDIETEKDLELTENKVDESEVDSVLHNLETNINSFVQKLAKSLKIQPKKIKQLGQGGYAYAFEIPGNKVLKVTSDYSDFVHATNLVGKNNKHIVNVYETYKIDEPYEDVFVIISEKLIQNNSIGKFEDALYDVIEEYSNIKNFPWENIHQMIDDVEVSGSKKYLKDINIIGKNLPSQYSNIYKQFIGMLDAIHENGINVDFHCGNLGFKSNGNLALLDFGDNSDVEFNGEPKTLSINELTHKLTNNKKPTDIVKFLKDKKFKNPKSKMFLYHGTKINPKDFNLRDDYNGEDSNGWSGDLPEGYLFLTTDINEAKAYGQYVIPCELESYSHIFFKVNSDAPSQVFDDDFGVSVINTHVKVNQFGFWDEYMNSGKANLIIKGNRNKWTIISPIENVIPRVDLANEFYNSNKELGEQQLNKLKKKDEYQPKGQAAGCLIFAKDTGRFLLLKRSEGDKLGTWGIVGGGIDKGENRLKALHREIGEEIPNIKGVKLSDLTMVFKNKVNDNFEYFNYIGKVDKEFTPELNYEHSKSQWCDKNNIPENLHPGVQALLIKLKLMDGKEYQERLMKEGTFDKLSNEDIVTYVRDLDYDSYWGDQSDDKIISYYENLMENEFPIGLKNIPKNLTLYRVLFVKDGEKNINTKEFGRHSTGLKNITTNIDFLSSIDYPDYNEYLKGGRLYRVTFKTTSDQIDIGETIKNRMEYPNEYEITLVENPKVKVIEVEDISKIAYDLKETLNEDFQSTKEIRKLSGDIIKLLADKNLDNVNQNLNDKIKFNSVKLSDVNPSNYIKLNQFIQNYSLYIELVENITNLYKGNYASFIKERGVTRSGDIELYYHDNLIDSLKDELKYGNGKIDSIKLYTIFYFKFANNLMHELQHVYDDYRSLGKALRHQDVYDTKYNKTPSNSKVINLQQAKDYLNLPHEIWARFTQAIDRIHFYSLDFNDKGELYKMYPMENVAKDFKKQFKGFDILSDDMKRRLIKAVIQFWHFEQEELKKGGKLNENNLLANNNYIDIPEAKLKYWEMIFKKYPGNMSTYALQIISSIKRNHNKATPKQNMYIQKALRGDNNWGNKN